MQETYSAENGQDSSADDVHEDRKATELVRKEEKEFKTVMNITYNLH